MSTYELHQLGWHGFQQLCLTISREVLGQTVQGFLNSRDGGRDGAFVGKWLPRSGETLSGKFVIQCKFTSKANKALRFSDLSDEIEKAKRLVEKNCCDFYLLLTNFGISGTTAEKIEEEFLAVGVKHFLCYGADWICQQIQERRRLRMLVPRIYGLGDLSQILDERAYSQAIALLDSMREDLSKIVLTQAYSRAVRALDEHGFVLLLGEPACGKTTIAAMLAMAAIDQWHVSMKLESATEMAQRWNPEEPHQFFWVDDAFGVMQYEAPLALEWNRIFPKVRAMISAGARVVLTSRDYIYKRARPNLKESAFPLIRESQVVVDVRDITKEERRQILYNHIKLGSQPRRFRTIVKPHLDKLASLPRFAPETARRLGNPLFTRNLVVSDADLTNFVEKQEEFLEEVIQGLDAHSQASLALIFIRSGGVESPIRLRRSEEAALSRLGSSLGDAIAALNALRDSLVVNLKEDGKALWKFKHPTVGDAYATIVLKNPELMDIYIEGAPVDKLIETITCGNVNLQGAIVVPKSLYPLVLEKISAFINERVARFDLKNWERKSSVDWFLTHRCDRSFLTMYLERYPETLERVSSPGLRLSAVSEVELAVRFFKFGLLTERYRKEFVKSVTRYAVEGEDGYVFENEDIRRMFTPKEDKDLLARVRKELVPILSDVRRGWQGNYPSDEDPESYMRPFLDLLSSLKREFPTDTSLLEIADKEISRAENWAEETHRENPEHGGDEYEDPEYDWENREPLGAHSPERSIFDDVDH